MSIYISAGPIYTHAWIDNNDQFMVFPYTYNYFLIYDFYIATNYNGGGGTTTST